MAPWIPWNCKPLVADPIWEACNLSQRPVSFSDTGFGASGHRDGLEPKSQTRLDRPAEPPKESKSDRSSQLFGSSKDSEGEEGQANSPGQENPMS